MLMLLSWFVCQDITESLLLFLCFFVSLFPYFLASLLPWFPDDFQWWLSLLEMSSSSICRNSLDSLQMSLSWCHVESAHGRCGRCDRWNMWHKQYKTLLERLEHKSMPKYGLVRWTNFYKICHGHGKSNV